MKTIFFITGASGVGKTTLVSALENKYHNNNDWVFLHFDSIGVPSPDDMIAQFGSGENWQKQMTYRWIDTMIGEYTDKKIIIFEGQVNLKFIKEGFSNHNFLNYEIILIDCNEEKMVQRLVYERNQAELVNDDMKNWLQYLRNQAKDFGAHIIDTSNISKEAAMLQCEEIIKSTLFSIIE